MTKAVLVSTLFALVGCALTPQQQAERMLAAYGPACDKLGFASGTDGHRQCVMQFDAQKQTQDAQTAALLMQYSANLQAQQAEINRRNRPLRTNCMQTGDFINCTTN